MVNVRDKKLLIQVREAGEFDGKGFFLHSGYSWKLHKDSNGATVLVPYPKKRKKAQLTK